MTSIDRKGRGSPADDIPRFSLEAEDLEVITLRLPGGNGVERVIESDVNVRREQYNYRMQLALLNVLQQRNLMKDENLIGIIERIIVTDKGTELMVEGDNTLVYITVPFDEMFEEVLKDSLVGAFEDFLDKST